MAKYEHWSIPALMRSYMKYLGENLVVWLASPFVVRDISKQNLHNFEVVRHHDDVVRNLFEKNSHLIDKLSVTTSCPLNCETEPASFRSFLTVSKSDLL